MKRCWFVLLFLLVASQTANANDKDPNELLLAKWDAVVKDPNDANELLQAKHDAVLKILKTTDIDQKVKEKIIDKIISPIFDFPLMGKLALGRKHWPKLTPPQREKFTSLFTKRLKASYLEKTALFKDEKALLGPSVQKKNTIHIPMVLTSPTRKITMLYKFHKVGKHWKIYDVEIQGVSIILTYRSQFDDILSYGTVKDLISQLEEPRTN